MIRYIRFTSVDIFLLDRFGISIPHQVHTVDIIEWNTQENLGLRPCTEIQIWTAIILLHLIIGFWLKKLRLVDYKWMPLSHFTSQVWIPLIQCWTSSIQNWCSVLSMIFLFPNPKCNWKSHQLSPSTLISWKAIQVFPEYKYFVQLCWQCSVLPSINCKVCPRHHNIFCVCSIFCNPKMPWSLCLYHSSTYCNPCLHTRSSRFWNGNKKIRQYRVQPGQEMMSLPTEQAHKEGEILGFSWCCWSCFW